MPQILSRSLIATAWAAAYCALAAEATAAVAVLSNRTAQTVTVEVLGGTAKWVTLGSGDSRPVFFDRSARIRYGDGLEQQTAVLEPSCAYYLSLGPAGRGLHFGKIGLGPSDTEESSPEVPVQRRTPPDQTVTIPVKILVDDDEPTHQSIWEERLRARVAKASEVLHSHCGVRFDVVAVEKWESDDSHNDFHRTFREFEQKVSPHPGQLAIGFSSQYQISRGQVHMGGSRGPLHPYILLKERSPKVLEPERLELLVHELGHFLGASHSPEPHSAMRPMIEGGRMRFVGSRIQFDPVNTLLMSLVVDEVRSRQVRNVAQIAPATKRRMQEIYEVLKLALPDDPAAGHLIRMLNLR